MVQWEFLSYQKRLWELGKDTLVAEDLSIYETIVQVPSNFFNPAAELIVCG